MDSRFCPVCGSSEVWKNRKLAQLVFSCRSCLSNFLVIVTKIGKNITANDTSDTIAKGS